MTKLKRGERQEKVVVLEHYGGTYTLPELIAICERELAKVPEDYRTRAKFEVVKEEEWYQYEQNPSVSANLVMVYSRPETDEELAKRQEESDKQTAAQDERDRREFERLQKKLGK